MRTTFKKLLKNSKQKIKDLKPKRKRKVKVGNQSQPTKPSNNTVTSITEQLKGILKTPINSSTNSKGAEVEEPGMEGLANTKAPSQGRKSVASDTTSVQDIQRLAKDAAHLYVKYADFFSLAITDNVFYKDFMSHYKYATVFYQNFDLLLAREGLDLEYQNLLIQQDTGEFTRFFVRHPELTHLVTVNRKTLLLIATKWYEVYYPEIDPSEILTLIEDQVSSRQDELDEYKLDQDAIVKYVAAQVLDVSQQMSEVYLKRYAISCADAYTSQQIELKKIGIFIDRNRSLVDEIVKETIEEYAAKTFMACDTGTYKTLIASLKIDEKLLLDEVKIEMSKHDSLHYAHTMRRYLVDKLENYFTMLNTQIIHLDNYIVNYNILQVSDNEILAKIPAKCELDAEQSVKLTHHFSTIINKKMIRYCFNLPDVRDGLLKFIDAHAAERKHKTLAQIGKEERTPQDFADLKMIRAVIETNLGLKDAAPIKELLKVLVVLAQNPESGKNKAKIDYHTLITNILLAMFRDDLRERTIEIDESFDDFITQNNENLSPGTKMYLIRKMQNILATANNANLDAAQARTVDKHLLQGLLTRFRYLKELDAEGNSQPQKTNTQQAVKVEEATAQNVTKSLPPLPAIPQKITKPLPAIPVKASKQTIAETESPVIAKKSHSVFFTPQSSFETMSNSPGFCTPKSSFKTDSQSTLFFTPQASPQSSSEQIPQSESLKQIIEDLDDLDNLLEEIIKLDKNTASSKTPKR